MDVGSSFVAEIIDIVKAFLFCGTMLLLSIALTMLVCEIAMRLAWGDY